MTTIDLRGRDLTITPPTKLLELPTPALLDSLFGPYLPKALRAKMGRDKRFGETGAAATTDTLYSSF